MSLVFRGVLIMSCLKLEELVNFRSKLFYSLVKCFVTLYLIGCCDTIKPNIVKQEEW